MQKINGRCFLFLSHRIITIRISTIKRLEKGAYHVAFQREQKPCENPAGRRERKMEWKDGKIEGKGIEILNLGYTMRAWTNTGKERDLRGKTWVENCLTFQGSSCPQRRFRVSKTAKIVNTNCLMLPRCAALSPPLSSINLAGLYYFGKKGALLQGLHVIIIIS